MLKTTDNFPFLNFLFYLHASEKVSNNNVFEKKKKFQITIVVYHLCVHFGFLAARSLLEKGTKEGSAEKGNGNVFKPNQGVEQEIHDDLATMDYTPAGKNPPIHN